MTAPTKVDENTSSRLQFPFFQLSLVGSAGLVAMGIVFIFNTQLAAALFGVPLFGGADGTYVTVAAVRDVAFGMLGLVFALAGSPGNGPYGLSRRYHSLSRWNIRAAP